MSESATMRVYIGTSSSVSGVMAMTQGPPPMSIKVGWRSPVTTINENR